ncbi:hypothetical protein K378_04091 [Streptomyces sp. Amel2xB2]|uniref:TrmB family transcriptional regulator n=1 Tax=Streptomyces sp. Amel2xB2 TaxID=1305829 RepID=UPI000DBFF5FF|nr:TrmB family transcriptional regulator [Streptomyces sp. Amel2xB2]RAJ61731.1 hypothetical protein K378_04091 [Streptomyces sp. Amel2xB2]
MSDEIIRYSRWHTPRVVAANALDILADLTDIVCALPGLYAGVLAASAAIGDSPTHPPSDAPGLALVALACFGTGRIVRLALSAPAKRLHPAHGHLPGWAVPARIRTRVHNHLDKHGESRAGEIADELDLPRSTVSSALRYLATDGMAVKSRWGVWTSTPRSQHRGPQIPLPGGDAR